MYAWYTRKDENGQTQFELTSGAALAGCKGMIANELGEIVTAKDTKPFGWTIPVAEKWNKQNYSFVIDIRPNSSETFLCEVDRAFGYCLDGWTLVILRLKLILKASEPVDKRNFICAENREIIYSIIYLEGSIENGQLVGTWSLPNGPMTALPFPPQAMTFFMEQVRKWDPEALEVETQLMEGWRKSSGKR